MSAKFLFAWLAATLSNAAMAATFDFSGCTVNEIVVAGDQNAQERIGVRS